MSKVQGDVTAINVKLEVMIARTAENQITNAKYAGGIATGRWIIGGCIAAIGASVTLIAWLFTHGLHF
jgi:hypothetical protein